MSILLEPFMLRALAAGLVVAALSGALGVLVGARKLAFFGDGISHASLAGIAVAVLAGWAPLPVAIAWGTAVALGIWKLERSTKLPADSLIGVFFTASLSLGVILLSFAQGYRPELLSYLFGTVLAVREADLVATSAIALAVAAWLAWRWRGLAFAAVAEDSARAAGVPVDRDTACLYAALAVTAVLGAKLLGVALVSALLIIPAATSRLAARSLAGHLVGSVALAMLAVVAGIVASASFDLPTGASVVLAAALAFFVAVPFARKA
jgi:zinc transport system permease protein